MPTLMSGWMTKCNLLVRGRVPAVLVPTPASACPRCGAPRGDGGEMFCREAGCGAAFAKPRTWKDDMKRMTGSERVAVAGYQICSLDFERGLGGFVKVEGARRTQRVPSHAARYEVSIPSDVAAGAPFSVDMRDAADGAPLVRLRGTLAELAPEEQPFARFVCERPHKFLVQDGGATVAYAPEDDGSGASRFSAVGCVGVRLDGELETPILTRVIGSERAARLDLARAVLFVQPEYCLVDHDNTPLEAAVVEGGAGPSRDGP